MSALAIKTMVDYAFYRDAYLGSIVSEKAFPEAAARAKEYLECLKNRFRVVSSGEETEKLALCAMAEAVYQAGKRSGISSASMGSVSVHYRNASDRSLNRELYRKAAIYLDIYRGVSG